MRQYRSDEKHEFFDAISRFPRFAYPKNPPENSFRGCVHQYIRCYLTRRTVCWRQIFLPLQVDWAWCLCNKPRGCWETVEAEREADRTDSRETRCLQRMRPAPRAYLLVLMKCAHPIGRLITAFDICRAKWSHIGLHVKCQNLFYVRGALGTWYGMVCTIPIALTFTCISSWNA